MFQSNITYYIAFLSSLILYPIMVAFVLFIIGEGGASFVAFIIIMIGGLTNGLTLALITATISIKLRDKFLQENSNIIKIKWLIYTIISGVLVSIIIPSAIFCFGDKGAQIIALLLLLIFGVSSFVCTLLACAILLYKDRRIKLKREC